MIYGFGESGFNPHRFVFNELEEPIDLYAHEAMNRMHYDGRSIVFWRDRDRFLKDLEDFLPGPAPDLRKLYAFLEDLYRSLIAKDPIFVSPSETRLEDMRALFMADPAKQLYMISLLSRSAASLVRRFTRDQAALKFLNKLTSVYTNTELVETPAILSATMFVDNHEGGTYYPAGGAIQLTGRLERALEKYGGRVRCRAEAASLIVEGGRARGVRLADGEMLEADAVIFSGTVWDLYGHFLPPGSFPASALRKVERLRPSPPSSVVYGVVARSGLPEDVFPIEVFADSPDRIDERDVTCYFPSLEDPSLAPAWAGGEDALAFLLIGPAYGRWPSGASAYQNAGYAAAKEAERERMIDLVDGHFHGFKEAVIFSEAGTPSTIERYLGKRYGAVAGPLQAMGQEMMRRQRARTPVKGLFACGESTVMGTGTPAVTISAISAADMVLREAGLPEYRAHPQERNYVRIIPRGERGNAMGRPELAGALDCQWCEKPECMRACPAGIDLPNLMRRIYCSNFEGAWRLSLPRAEGAEAGPPCLSCPAFCEAPCTLRDLAGRPVPIKRTIIALHRGK